GVQEEAFFRQGKEPPPVLAIDGIFGPKTEAWVRGFQEGAEITVDGIVGPVTWRVLVSGLLAGWAGPGPNSAPSAPRGGAAGAGGGGGGGGGGGHARRTRGSGGRGTYRRAPALRRARRAGTRP